jgi:hypothetical protein
LLITAKETYAPIDLLAGFFDSLSSANLVFHPSMPSDTAFHFAGQFTLSRLCHPPCATATVILFKFMKG